MYQHQVLSDFLFDYREYKNFLKGKGSKRIHLSTMYVNNKTFSIYLLNDLLFASQTIRYRYNKTINRPSL